MYDPAYFSRPDNELSPEAREIREVIKRMPREVCAPLASIFQTMVIQFIQEGRANGLNLMQFFIDGVHTKSKTTAGTVELPAQS